MNADLYYCWNGHESTCEEADVPCYRDDPDKPMALKCPLAGCNAPQESQHGYFIRLAILAHPRALVWTNRS